MSEKSIHNAILGALHKAIKGTPLAFLSRLTPAASTTSEQFNGELDDGSQVLFERRITAIQCTDALRRAKDGSSQPLGDGTYRLKDGSEFRVVDGHINFDLVLGDPLDRYGGRSAWQLLRRGKENRRRQFRHRGPRKTV
jgi:hypothetical protein